MSMIHWLLIGVAALPLLGACAYEGVGQNPDPIPHIEYERTTRLLELRESLAAKNLAHEQSTGDKLRRNTNKRQMGSLADEYANWDRRAQDQVERELARRYQQGELRAWYPGLEARVPGAQPPPEARP
jgi:hypothetical protein